MDVSLEFARRASLTETAPDAAAEAAARHAQCRRVLRWAADLVAEVAASPAQQALLDTALTGLHRYGREVAVRGGHVFSVSLPLAVHAAITGREEGAVPLAAACGLADLAIDLFDDLADGDRADHWTGHSPGEMSLAAATILGALPPLILARLDTEPARRLRMQEILARGGLRASAGQQEDLRQAGAPEVAAGEVVAAVTGKTGERFATYCALAAEMAGADPGTAALYAGYGREVGVAVQLLSDCHDVLVDPGARDLAHGTRTLPIVVHLNQLDDAGRPGFLTMLDRARTDRDAQALVRDALRASGAVRRVMVRAQLCRARARRMVDEAGAREPGRDWLLALAATGLEDADAEQHTA